MDLNGSDNIYVKENTIYFPPGKALLNNLAIDFIVEVVNKIKDDPTKKLLVEVYCDSNQEYLIKDYICRLRSEEVVGYLINNGLSFDRMSINNIGYRILANKCAKDVKCSDEEHQENRRVRFSILNASQFEALEINDSNE